MPEEYEVRLERVDDINAEHWEELAELLPSSMEDLAKSYREIAKRYRESGDQKKVRVHRQRTPNPR